MNLTAFFTLPFYPMPDESKAGLKPGGSWFEINPTCSPVFITEGTGLIFQTLCMHSRGVLPKGWSAEEDGVTHLRLRLFLKDWPSGQRISK
jgi:hypothetical protein